jgi:hypothetical protein
MWIDGKCDPYVFYQTRGGNKMKKKYLVGSVLIALLMLVCTLLVFLDPLKADSVATKVQ